LSEQILKAKSRLGVAVRRGGDVPAARRDLAAAKIEKAIRENVAAAPPLTKAQINRLSVILSGGDAK
jgi:hypothetical protein